MINMDTDTPDVITLEQMKDAVAQVVAENPNAINPTLGADRGCAYTRHPDDTTPLAAEHCIGGTVLLRLGLELPPEGKTVYHSQSSGRMASDARTYLRTVQLAADGFTKDSVPPGPLRRWADAVTFAESEWPPDSWSEV